MYPFRADIICRNWSRPVENTDIHATTMNTATEIMIIKYERMVDNRLCPSLDSVAD
jgi:hypothetical protein